MLEAQSGVTGTMVRCRSLSMGHQHLQWPPKHAARRCRSAASPAMRCIRSTAATTLLPLPCAVIRSTARTLPPHCWTTRRPSTSPCCACLPPGPSPSCRCRSRKVGGPRRERGGGGREETAVVQPAAAAGRRGGSASGPAALPSPPLAQLPAPPNPCTSFATLSPPRPPRRVQRHRAVCAGQGDGRRRRPRPAHRAHPRPQLGRPRQPRHGAAVWGVPGWQGAGLGSAFWRAAGLDVCLLSPFIPTPCCHQAWPSQAHLPHQSTACRAVRELDWAAEPR